MIRELELELKNKKRVKAKILSRGGSLSPDTMLLYIGKRWVTPFEQKRKKISLSTGGYFSYLYQEPLKTLLISNNHLLKSIPKQGDFCGKYVAVPFNTKGQK